MAKAKKFFECDACGYRSPKWVGQCPTCKQWETMQEGQQLERRDRTTHEPAKVIAYSQVENVAQARFSSGMAEFDRVLGEGFVPGSLLLIGGDPGIGKSTLMLQVAAHLQAQGQAVLYVSGEESLSQIKMRGERLQLQADRLCLLAETAYEALEQVLETQSFDVLFIDSIQTMYTGSIASGPGSVSQVREMTTRLLSLCKTRNITTILVGHITKGGSLAGPKTLEHMVDGVFYFEGDTYQNLRLIRAQKNRFGPAQELGIFQMDTQGLKEVPNPSSVLLAQRPKASPGSVVVPCMTGTRPLMVEIQVLLSSSTYASPRRLAMGIEGNRLALILAVLEKKAGVQLQGLDVFVNVVGGLSITEPAADLGLALAIYSSFRNIAFAPEVAVFGELGLAGEIRAVSQAAMRVKECANLGFSRVLCPGDSSALEHPDVAVVTVSSLIEALEKAL